MGGASRRLPADLVALQRALSGVRRQEEPGVKGFVIVRRSGGKPPTAQPEAETKSVAEASLDATIEEAVKWSFKRVTEVLLDTVHPGLGRLVNVASKLMEVLGDAAALASPDRARDLHVPLLGPGDGIALDLNVHLQGHDGTRDDTPLISGFIAPADDGLFGGWQLEIARHAMAAEEKASQPKQDTWTLVAAEAQSTAHQAAPAGHYELHLPVELTTNLAAARSTDDPFLVAVTLREAASRLQGELHSRSEFADVPIIVIYDHAAGLGMWLAKPDAPKKAELQRIEIRLNAATGLTAVFCW